MRLTELTHQILTDCLRSGDLAIDATAGNGHDTLKMASLVGQEGEVVAIDIQEAAITATRLHLQKSGCLDQVRLVCDDHAAVLAGLSSRHRAQAAAITFNLGYLPGGDHQKITTPETTVAALKASLPLLKPAAPLLVTAYRGHPGGQAEADAVAHWIPCLDPSQWSVACEDPPARTDRRKPPILWTIRRRNDSCGTATTPGSHGAPS